jgi:MFS family permease
LGKAGRPTGRYKLIVTVALIGASLSYLPQGLVDSSRQLLGLRAVLGVCNAAIGPPCSPIASSRPNARWGLWADGDPMMLGNVVGPAAGLLRAAMGICWSSS